MRTLFYVRTYYNRWINHIQGSSYNPVKQTKQNKFISKFISYIFSLSSSFFFAHFSFFYSVVVWFFITSSSIFINFLLMWVYCLYICCCSINFRLHSLVEILHYIPFGKGLLGRYRLVFLLSIVVENVALQTIIINKDIVMISNWL